MKGDEVAETQKELSNECLLFPFGHCHRKIYENVLVQVFYGQLCRKLRHNLLAVVVRLFRKIS
jgi:hypothetical protein